MSDTKYTFGMFVWRELLTKDIEQAKGFYGELFNWKITKAPMEGMDYYIASVGDRQVAGLFEMKSAPMPANWGSYVSVPDVDAAVAASTAAGGKTLNGPMDVPHVGRMATLQDPQGAVFNVFKASTGDPVPSESGPVPGDFCWEQLNTTDVAGARAFYPSVTGWKDIAFNGMSTFAVNDGPRGGVASYMQAPPGVPSHWLTYVVVPNLNDANTRATRLGAKVMMERIDVPTIGSFSVLQDPGSAYICLFESAPR